METLFGAEVETRKRYDNNNKIATVKRDSWEITSKLALLTCNDGNDTMMMMMMKLFRSERRNSFR